MLPPECPEQQESVTDRWGFVGRRFVLLFDHLVRAGWKAGCGGHRRRPGSQGPCLEETLCESTSTFMGTWGPDALWF